MKYVSVFLPFLSFLFFLRKNIIQNFNQTILVSVMSLDSVVLLRLSKTFFHENFIRNTENFPGLKVCDRCWLLAGVRGPGGVPAAAVAHDCEGGPRLVRSRVAVSSGVG